MNWVFVQKLKLATMTYWRILIRFTSKTYLQLISHSHVQYGMLVIVAADEWLTHHVN